MQHSIRLYEKAHEANLLTKIVKIVEQPIKVNENGKSSILSTLGIVLSETIFHPQSGGQPADKGTLNDVPVLAVNLEKTQEHGTIYHFLDPRQLRNKRFSVGQQVTMNLNETFRMQCQRSHTAGHLIADVMELNPLFETYQAKAIKGHHFPGGEYVKFLVSIMPVDTEKFIQQINDCLNVLVSADLPVAVNYHPNGIRHIKMVSSARMCGGTHVKTTKTVENCVVSKVKIDTTANGIVELTVFYSC